MDWRALLNKPGLGDHVVQLYQDDNFLTESVTGYLQAGLAKGEAAIVIATTAHRNAFAVALRRAGVDVEGVVGDGRLRMLDAADTLAEFSYEGVPDPAAFVRVVGGLVREALERYPAVRAYGEMVDLLWQKGARDRAIRLEELWNELAKALPFSLLCAYRMDGLDPRSYAGPLQCVCGTHTHLIPARDTERFDEAVVQASREVLDDPLSRMMLALAERHAAATAMPAGQKALFWLQKNMPLTAERVLAAVRARY